MSTKNKDTLLKTGNSSPNFVLFLYQWFKQNKLIKKKKNFCDANSFTSMKQDSDSEDSDKCQGTKRDIRNKN